ncbi:MAG TPA: XdhC family protein [Thermoanaerobaculia bacterium]|jgi:xanthine/CO dehydrogenase XdhC/CoxF family maturation factor|nr:XdhC family protein [Thermoanaerobaculia bacterium]
MNHWKETAEVVSRLTELAAAGQRAALATVVHIVGSAYRRPGAKFLIAETGGTLGSVSGGCLEADVREVARDVVIATGAPSLRHYKTGADEDMVWGLGLGCNGMVDVFIQPATEGPLAAITGRLRELLAGDSPFALATVVDGSSDLGATQVIEADGSMHGSLGPADVDTLAVDRARGLMASGRSGVHRLDGRGVFVEILPPPPHLLVCGAGDDAQPLVAYAADAGFRVTVLDHRPALLTPERFPQAARLVAGRPDADVQLPPAQRSRAVVMAHSLAIDRGWAQRHLASGVPYVGMLGPRERTVSILREIGAEGEIDAGRVFGPVGLDLGADGPRQVAISIIAELLAFEAKREPRHLNERREAIHAVV